MFESIGGKIGEILVSLAFSSALVAMISFLIGDQREGQEKKSWERMGTVSFVAHILSIIGIIATLFVLIHSHNYEYHYVWAHSSNELPVHFMISCFWEGQEGSFLLWAFWHGILGGILLFNKSEWRNSVLAIVASVNLIITSMLLGVYVSSTWVTGIYLVLALLPGFYFAFHFFQKRDKLPLNGNFHIFSLIVATAFLLLLFRGQLGYNVSLIPGQGEMSLDGIGFWLFLWVMIGYTVMYGFFAYESHKSDQNHFWALFAGAALAATGLFAVFFEPETWKLGSTPFLSLRAAFPEDEVWLTDPNFIPSNGNGLNPLLQNYWMVIHPPTLFLGFASTTIPFAFVMSSLIRRKYTDWIKPALPWMSFSVMILGIGIIMGGYWAYETLNFGGYWNWDPVENSSFVPWLCGVASLHAMLIFRKTKSYLTLSMLMIIFTFLLVLYSTFLTRSGILGENSVHTFTDLGLTGQLLVLIGLYTAFVIVMMLFRGKEIPNRPDDTKVMTAEFWLLIGVIVFIFSSLMITVATSLPVFNKIFGTNLAPPPNVQLFYYNWNVWFAIMFGVASGIGQFLWWNRAKGKQFADAIFRPFLLAVIVGVSIMVSIWWADWEFAFDSERAKIIDPELMSPNFFKKIGAYIQYGILSVTDELLLFSSLFGLFANLDVLISLLRKNKKGLKVMGGTVVHIGFALMLIGMLFSSGYDSVISKNLRPGDLARFPEEERIDNVLLPKDQKVQILNYDVTYLGKKEAEAPVSDLSVLEENIVKFKLAFRDKSGKRWALILPRGPFLKKENTQAVNKNNPRHADHQKELLGEVDLELVKRKLNEDLAAFEPQRINTRVEYGLQFKNRGNEKDEFTLFATTELNKVEEGIIPHPSRKIYWNRDIYVYTSSLPAEDKAETKFFNLDLQIGQSAKWESFNFKLENLINLSQRPDLKGYDVAAAANLVVTNGGQSKTAQPIFTIKGNKPGMIQAGIKEFGLDFAFVGIEPEKNLVHLQGRFVNPEADFVIIKAIQKPFINLLWLGTFILTAGFLISIYRRTQEIRKGRKAA
ncbi:MAG: cytochrome c biogenesis protein CcsA [Bacteroidia bacterium]|nr:cytochrome c biogenesis protein CcsA [Bacteroidia bacterium]